jgi:hypothetical protein
MGTLVTAAAKEATKPQYTVETVLAGSVAVLDGEFAVFIGANQDPQTIMNAGKQKCLQALREAHWPNPVTLEFSTASYDITTGSLTLSNGAAQTLTEDDVAIIQGFDFNRAESSNSGHVHRLFEAGLEQALKVA